MLAAMGQRWLQKAMNLHPKTVDILLKAPVASSHAFPILNFKVNSASWKAMRTCRKQSLVLELELINSGDSVKIIIHVEATLQGKCQTVGCFKTSDFWRLGVKICMVWLFLAITVSVKDLATENGGQVLNL